MGPEEPIDFSPEALSRHMRQFFAEGARARWDDGLARIIVTNQYLVPAMLRHGMSGIQPAFHGFLSLERPQEDAPTLGDLPTNPDERHAYWDEYVRKLDEADRRSISEAPFVRGFGSFEEPTSYRPTHSLEDGDLLLDDAADDGRDIQDFSWRQDLAAQFRREALMVPASPQLRLGVPILATTHHRLSVHTGQGAAKAHGGVAIYRPEIRAYLYRFGVLSVRVAVPVKYKEGAYPPRIPFSRELWDSLTGRGPSSEGAAWVFNGRRYESVDALTNAVAAAVAGSVVSAPDHRALHDTQTAYYFYTSPSWLDVGELEEIVGDGPGQWPEQDPLAWNEFPPGWASVSLFGSHDSDHIVATSHSLFATYAARPRTSYSRERDPRSPSRRKGSWHRRRYVSSLTNVREWALALRVLQRASSRHPIDQATADEIASVLRNAELFHLGWQSNWRKWFYKCRETLGVDPPMTPANKKSIEITVKGGSHIGQLNLGPVVGSIQTSINTSSEHGEKDLSVAVARLTEAIHDSRELGGHEKERGLAILSEIARAAADGTEPSLGARAMKFLTGSIATAADVSEVWATWGPLIVAALGA